MNEPTPTVSTKPMKEGDASCLEKRIPGRSAAPTFKPEVAAKKGKGTQAQLEEFCVSIGMPRDDGTAMFVHFEEKGWAKIKDWKLTIRKWKLFGYLPSQKFAQKARQMSSFEIKERIQAVNDEISKIFKNPESKTKGFEYELKPFARIEIERLKAARIELKQQLLQ